MKSSLSEIQMFLSWTVTKVTNSFLHNNRVAGIVMFSYQRNFDNNILSYNEHVCWWVVLDIVQPQWQDLIMMVLLYWKLYKLTTVKVWLTE